MALEGIARYATSYGPYILTNLKTDISELNPANIGRFESEEMKKRWQEAEQFGGQGKYGRWHIANITVIPIIKN